MTETKTLERDDAVLAASPAHEHMLIASNAQPTQLPSLKHDPATNTYTLRIPGNLVLVIEGNEGRVVRGDSAVYSEGNITALARGEHHVQPSGAHNHRRLLGAALPGEDGAMVLMAMRHEQYKSIGEQARRREFYLRAARKNLMRKRKKGCGGCGCG